MILFLYKAKLRGNLHYNGKKGEENFRQNIVDVDSSPLFCL